MAEDSWKEKLIVLLQEVLDSDLDGDELKDAITQNIDLEELVGEVMEEDDEVKAALKAKIKQLLIAEINEISELSDLDDDFNLVNNLPEDYSLESIVGDLISTDSEIQTLLKKEILKAVKSDIEENLDSSHIPEWDDLKDLLGLEEQIKEMIQSDEIRALFHKELKGFVKKYFADYDEDNLPDEFWSEFLPTEVTKLLGSDEFQQAAKEELQKTLKANIIEILAESGHNSTVWQNISDNEQLTDTLTQKMSELLADREVVASLKQTIKEKLETDDRLTTRLINQIFEKMAEKIVSRLFRKDIL
ncbi:hypothetical protein ACFL2U_02770 [Patescibacteria group bacterium]